MLYVIIVKKKDNGHKAYTYNFRKTNGNIVKKV